jgi:hypothetical protein
LFGIPPATTQGNKKGNCILKTLGHCLQIADLCLMVPTIHDKNLYVVDKASLVICLYQTQRSLSRMKRFGLGMQSLSVVFECPQSIGNLGKGAKDALTIVGQGLLIVFNGRFPLKS